MLPYSYPQCLNQDMGNYFSMTTTNGSFVLEFLQIFRPVFYWKIFLLIINLLLDTGQLFKGHTKFCCVYNTRTQVQLRNCVLRHVSAHGLTSLIAPSYLKSHLTMNMNDKTIWDNAYEVE